MTRRKRNPHPALVAGILIGEGSSSCRAVRRKVDKEYRYRYPQVIVRMCDKKAIQHVANYLGTSVSQIPPIRCKPTPENPTGHIYATTSTGKPAIRHMKELQPYLENTEFWQSWQKTLKKCKES